MCPDNQRREKKWWQDDFCPFIGFGLDGSKKNCGNESSKVTAQGQEGCGGEGIDWAFLLGAIFSEIHKYNPENEQVCKYSTILVLYRSTSKQTSEIKMVYMFFSSALIFCVSRGGKKNFTERRPIIIVISGKHTLLSSWSQDLSFELILLHKSILSALQRCH